MRAAPESLWAAFRATTFTANAGERRVAIQVDTPESAELRATLDEVGAQEWAYVTAWNALGTIHTHEENEAANEHLRQEIETRGHLVFEGEGVPRAPSDHEPEASFLVLGISRNDAIELGRQFDQAAIVVGRRGQPAELVACAVSAPGESNP